jgi:ABC-type nitrate/sulfonate/bicarbonate transport system permease component
MYSLGNYPNLVILQLIPKIALAPLFVVWLGISSEFARRIRRFRQLLSGQ